MTALIALKNFEIAAYTAQQVNSCAPLVFQEDGAVVSSRAISPQQKQLNQRTWQVFTDMLKAVIGVEKFNWICRRYSFFPERMQGTGSPLLAEHVELFSIGTSQRFTQDLKRLLPRGRKIKQLTRLELQEKFNHAQPFQNILGAYLNPMYISGPPTDFRAWFLYDPLLMDREKHLLFSDVQQMIFPAFLERFCKAIVNRELFEKQIISAPGMDGHVDYYRVFEKISVGKGLMAYALKPAAADSTLKPLLIFRPTQMALSGEDAFHSYLNDLEPTVGKSGYIATKPLLDRLIKNSSFLRPGQKLNIAGYSLGGSHAQHFIADYHSYVSSAYFYNNPSIDEETVLRFAAEVKASDRQDPLNIIIFRTVGDFIDSAGKKHIGYNLDDPRVNIELHEINHESKEIAALSLHAFKIFDNSQTNYHMNCITNSQALFNHLDNSKRGPSVLWYERMRQIWGKALYIYLYVLYGFLRGVEKAFGVKFLRST